MPINTSANLNSIIGASIARNLDKTNTSVALGSVNVAKNTKNVTKKLVESQELVRDTRNRTENIIKSILETTHVMSKEDIGNIFDNVNKQTAKPTVKKEKIEEEPQQYTIEKKDGVIEIFNKANNNSIKEDN